MKLHFLQNTPLVQLYASVCDSKHVENILGSHIVKDFSALTSHSLSPQQRCPFNADFSRGDR